MFAEKLIYENIFIISTVYIILYFVYSDVSGKHSCGLIYFQTLREKHHDSWNENAAEDYW